MKFRYSLTLFYPASSDMNQDSYTGFNSHSFRNAWLCKKLQNKKIEQLGKLKELGTLFAQPLAAKS